MSTDNVTPLNLSPTEEKVITELAGDLAELRNRRPSRPPRPRPVVHSLVERNEHYSTPVRVLIDVKAATPEEALTALSRAYTAVRKQARTMSDQDAAELGDGQ